MKVPTVLNKAAKKAVETATVENRGKTEPDKTLDDSEIGALLR